MFRQSIKIKTTTKKSKNIPVRVTHPPSLFYTFIIDSSQYFQHELFQLRSKGFQLSSHISCCRKGNEIFFNTTFQSVLLITCIFIFLHKIKKWLNILQENKCSGYTSSSLHTFIIDSSQYFQHELFQLPSVGFQLCSYISCCRKR